MQKTVMKLLPLLLCLSVSWTSAYAANAGSSAPLLDLGAELEKMKPSSASGQTMPTAPSHSPTPAKSVMEKTPTTDNSKAHKSGKANQAHAVHWGYAGDEGPAHWGDLSPENVNCKIGKNQSPINLKDKAAVGTTGLPQLDIKYRDVPLKVLNNGHTVQVNYPLGSYIKVGGHRYELLQFHFHTPSEHKKEGFNYPMEVHLVHKDGEGNLAVLGIIFQEGEENSVLNTLLRHLPTDIGKQHIHKEVSLNPVNFFPGNTEFYKYSGSLTTPPCSEGVYWMVFKHPIEASAEQIEKMNELMGDNARPTQPANARALLKSWADQLQEPPMYEFY